MDKPLDIVIGCIRKVSQQSAAPIEITPDVRLFDGGIIDSFGVLNLVGELESRFGVAIATEDLTIQNFETPARIVVLIENYRKNAIA